MPKILGNQVLPQKEIPEGELSFLTRNSKRLFVSKAKNLIEFVWLKTEIIHGRGRDYVVLLRYGFFQQTITESDNNNSAWLFMGGRSRSNSVEKITLHVPSLGPRFLVFVDCVRVIFKRFQASQCR